jgi:hypothetical protein
MHNKTLNLFIFIYIIIAIPCFSQIAPQNIKKEHLLNEYNGYLKSVHLDQLINASDFSFQDTISQNVSLGVTKLSSVNILTLEPNSKFTDPIEFSAAWKNILDTIKNKTDIYSQLFFKLADYTGLQPQSLVISLRIGESGIFSFIIYFDNGVKVNEARINGKGAPVTPINFDPGDLNNSMFGGFLPNVTFRQDLMAKLNKSIYSFLKNNRHETKEKVIVTQKDWGTAHTHFTANNIKGQVTNKFYETICITLVISPADEKGKADIAFYFTVSFASGDVAPSKYEDYENAVKVYPVEVSAYGAGLKGRIQTIIDGKNH